MEPLQSAISQNIGKEISHYLNWRLRFRSNELQAEFFEFCQFKRLSFIVSLLAGFFTFIICPLNIGYLLYSPNVAIGLLSLAILIASILVATSGVFIFMQQTYFQGSKFFLSWLPFMQTLMIVSVTIHDILIVFRFSFGHECEHPSGIVMRWYCRKFYGGLASYGAFLTITSLAPIFLAVGLNEARIDLILLCLVVGNFSCTGLALYFSILDYMAVSLLWIIVSGLICIDMHLSHVENFIRHKKLQEALKENERIQQEDRATELRHMIGNVAHDLKTVSIPYLISSPPSNPQY
jgi:hypothetical protein